MFFITKEFTFDAAHNLTMYHGKCEKLHGHTYKLQVTVAGEKQEEDMVIDFLKMKEIVRDEVLSVLDHSYINDVLSQPTAENIAEWIFNKLAGKIRGNSFELYEVAFMGNSHQLCSLQGEMVGRDSWSVLPCRLNHS